MHIMNEQCDYKVTIIDAYDDAHEIPFKRHALSNLMELIVNSYYEEIGDCKGRAWCGTCHVKDISNEILTETIGVLEDETLNKLEVRDATSRLACQVLLTESIHNKTFRIIGDV